MGEVIQVSEVHDLLNKIHDILSNAGSKWIANSAGILGFLFSSASR